MGFTAGLPNPIMRAFNSRLFSWPMDLRKRAPRRPAPRLRGASPGRSGPFWSVGSSGFSKRDGTGLPATPRSSRGMRRRLAGQGVGPPGRDPGFAPELGWLWRAGDQPRRRHVFPRSIASRDASQNARAASGALVGRRYPARMARQGNRPRASRHSALPMRALVRGPPRRRCGIGRADDRFRSAAVGTRRIDEAITASGRRGCRAPPTA